MIRVDERLVPRVGNLKVPVLTSPRDARATANTIDALAKGWWRRSIQTARDQADHRAREEVLTHTTATVERALDALDDAKRAAQDAMASDAVELAVEIARQLVKVRFHAGDYDLETIVRSTLACSDGRGSECEIHLHPDDASALEAVPFRSGTIVVPDPGLQRGHVHLHTAHGLLVRDPEAALDEIREQLLEDLVQ